MKIIILLNMESLDEKKQHILWIDGIKGLSCLFIVICHLFLCFFPSSYYGINSESKLYGIDTFLSSSPLGIFLNGNFFVFLFLFISGYVITHQMLNIKPEKFGLFHLKRYLKLMFPLLLYSLVFCILYRINNTLVTEMRQDINVSPFMLIKQGLYKILYFGEVSYGGHFWMMNYIFLGGIFVSTITATSWTLGIEKAFYISGFFTTLLFLNLELYFTVVFLACSYCILKNLNIKKIGDFQLKHSKFSKLIYFFLFIISIIFGSYPSGYTPDNFYRYLTLPIEASKSDVFYHMIAAFFFFASVSNLKFLQIFFESRPCLFLSKISYSVYIFHGLVLSYSRPIMSYIHIDNYIAATFLYFFISIFLTILFAYILTKYIFTPISRIVNNLR